MYDQRDNAMGIMMMLAEMLGGGGIGKTTYPGGQGRNMPMSTKMGPDVVGLLERYPQMFGGMFRNPSNPSGTGTMGAFGRNLIEFLLGGWGGK